jgi:hypothetical protein
MDWIGQESSGGWQPYRTAAQAGGTYQTPSNHHIQARHQGTKKHGRLTDKSRKGYRLAKFSWGSVLLAVVCGWGCLVMGGRTNSPDYETFANCAAVAIVLLLVAAGFIVAAIALAACAVFVSLNHLWEIRGMTGRIDKSETIVALLLSSPIVLLFIYVVARMILAVI